MIQYTGGRVVYGQVIENNLKTCRIKKFDDYSKTKVVTAACSLTSPMCELCDKATLRYVSHNYNAREGLSDEPNQWACELDFFRHFIVYQINLFAFQLTDSSVIMSDHLLHETWLISISPMLWTSGRTPTIGVIPPVAHPSIHCICLFLLSIQAQNGSPCFGRKARKHLGQVSSPTKANTISHLHSHMWKSQRLQSAWPACLWTAGKETGAPRGKALWSQVKFICEAQYHIKRLNRLYRLTMACSWPSPSSLRRKEEKTKTSVETTQ